ncbi:sialidase family protein [Arcanobacterium hippocoleae]
MPKISSDAAVAVNPKNGEIHIAFSTIPAHSKIGYFDSAYAGERLIPALLFGKNLHALDYRELTELYEILKDPGGKPLCPDAIFATSGSSIIWNGMALFPYVVRKANETFIYVVHLQDGAISAVSEPIYADNANLDETALAVFDGKIYLNSRVQGFAGVGAGIRYLAESSDGIHFSQPIPWYLADPGCNAKQIGNLFIHPHSISARENGAIIAVPTLNSLSVDSLSQTSLSVDSISVNSLSSTSLPPKTVHESPKILGQFPAGSFGYSDAAYFAGKLYVLYESNSGLCLAVFEQVDEQKTS